MKKIIGLLILAMSAFASFAENNDRTMAFSISPIAAIRGGIDVMYQLKLSHYLSLTVPANFYYSWFKSEVVSLSIIGHKSIKETKSPYDARIGVGARFLMAHKGLNDTFYLEPRLYLSYEQFGFNIDNYKFESEALILTPMFRFGWDWYYDSGFYVSLGAGVGVNTYLNKATKIPKRYRNDVFASAVFPPLEGAFGIAWEGEFKLGFAL